MPHNMYTAISTKYHEHNIISKFDSLVCHCQCLNNYSVFGNNPIPLFQHFHLHKKKHGVMCNMTCHFRVRESNRKVVLFNRSQLYYSHFSQNFVVYVTLMFTFTSFMSRFYFSVTS